MAVVDFRSGGFIGAQPRQVRDYPYGQDPRYQSSQDWQDDDQWEDDRYHADEHAPVAQDASVIGRVGRLTHYVGAVVSVGLMLMLLFWGYDLVMRDVSGVPVIRAMEGEARTAPDDPGGQLAARTGLAVNSVVAGVASGPANQVAIAPEPTGLGDEDLPMGEFGATARQPSRETELPLDQSTAPVVALSDAEAAAAAAEMAAVEAAIVDAPATEGPVNEAVTDLDGHVAAPDAINAVLAEVTGVTAPAAGGISSSPRPAPRPRQVASAAPATPASAAAPAAEAAPAPPAAPVQRVAPNALASGAPLVQIGAFDSNALAEGEWGRISGKNGSLFSGKAQVIQEAQSGGRTFWRLRVAGFDSRDEARQFCAALVAQGTDCIPATAQ